MSRFVFKCLAFAILSIIAITGFAEYFDYHQYYWTLISNWSNRGLVLRGLIAAGIPTSVMYFSKQLSLRRFLLSLLAGAVLYGIALVSTRGGLYGIGWLLLARNTFVLGGLGVLQTGIFLAIGDRVKQHVLPNEGRNWQRVGVSLTIGISIQLIVVYILMLLNILFPIISRILFILALWILRSYRKTLKGAWNLVQHTLLSFRQSLGHTKRSHILFGSFCLVLLVISLRYVFNGFELSFMPYTTAWDANHAYMFYPKMRALNNGVYWFEPGMQIRPDLWYAFLTFWFSLFGRSDGIGSVSVDTIVLSLNFWSGIYVLVLGCIMVHTLMAQKKHHALGFTVGRALLLVWLTSGMGAFLVFVDNKTDLGILALIVGAITTGFTVLKTLKGNGISTHERNGLIVSGALYAIAALAKPTALFDVINFAMYMSGILLGLTSIIMIACLVIGLLVSMEFRGIKDYLPESRGALIMAGGGLFGVGTIFAKAKKKLVFGVRVLLIRGGAVLVTLVLVRSMYLVGKVVTQDYSPTGSELIQSLLFSEKSPNDSQLFVQVGSNSLQGQCNLRSQGYQSNKELYSGLAPIVGSAYNEDVARYSGFGRKGNDSDRNRGIDPFVGTRWTGVVPSGCSVLSLNYRNELHSLCENFSQIMSLDTTTISQLSRQISDESGFGKLLHRLHDGINSNTGSIEELRSRLNPVIQELKIAVEGSTLYKNPETGEVFLPYKWIIPFNVSYNWSLQNLSSYYTDIGIMRLICYIFAFLGVIYGLVCHKNHVTITSLVTISGWTLWWFIASGIVRYSLGIIIWSIISFVIFVGSLFEHTDEEQRPLETLVQWGFLLILGGVIIVHLVINMVRIASQGGTGAFMQYKASVGKTITYNERLEGTNTIVTGFGKDDVFNLQFPHYRPFIDAMNTRDDNQGGLIAGTYIRYFIDDQSHIKSDQFLTWLRQNFSDNDTCNSYLRLQDNKIKYMAIDLNIGTVVQGEGNRSLFDRFFARVNTATNAIEDEGVISMLVKLSQQGYIRYVSSNNVGAKYAFTIPDDSFQGVEGEALRLYKSRMAVGRYFSNDLQLTDTILQIAQQRVLDGLFVTDIADIVGLEIREDILTQYARADQLSSENIISLTQSERKVLSQYLSLKQMYYTNQEQFATSLQNIIRSSIGGPNQILTLEVVD